jgi:hypothetical protein
MSRKPVVASITSKEHLGSTQRMPKPLHPKSSQITVAACETAGFDKIASGYAPDARSWWQEYAEYDQDCQTDPDGDKLTIQVDNGHWLSFGEVIA